MKPKIRNMLIIISILTLLSLAAFIEDGTRQVYLLKTSDLPAGYYPEKQDKDDFFGERWITERWRTIHPDAGGNCGEKYSSIAPLGPCSSVMIRKIYPYLYSTDKCFEMQKNMISAGNWIETAPNGKPLGRKCHSLIAVNRKGVNYDFIKTMFIKRNIVCIINITNMKNDGKLSLKEINSLIETVYERL